MGTNVSLEFLFGIAIAFLFLLLSLLLSLLLLLFYSMATLILDIYLFYSNLHIIWIMQS